ncbi:MAG: condensation domain-containing protein, partial [Candidatus Aminicenantes bacterium]|nr:condensation domain-containing protein [Candidatus Aminicenantes bacterium]
MLTKENIKNIYTLSPMQEGMFFHALYDRSSYVYFEQLSYRLQGDLNINFVKKSLDELFKRYDILRTIFVQKKAEKVLQVVLKERGVDFYYQDISTGIDTNSYLREFKENDKGKSFDLSKDVLMRVSVFKTGTEEYEFIWSHHHILMDGWCVGILVSEFFEIYTSFQENRSYKLAPVTPYKTYIDWLENQDREKSRRYWAGYLDGYEEAVGIPGRKIGRNEEAGFKNDNLVVTLDPVKTASLHSLAAAGQVTPGTIIRAVWGFVLSKYNNREDVVFGAVVSGRPGEIENVDK